MMEAQQTLTAAEVELEEFTKRVAELSWELLTTVPPLVCTQPSKYRHSQHQKAGWDGSRGDGNMIYFRPVLFSSYEGRVAKKGWVTNRPIGHPTKDKGQLRALNIEPGASQKTDTCREHHKTAHGQNSDTDSEHETRYGHSADTYKEHHETGRGQNSDTQEATAHRQHRECRKSKGDKYSEFVMLAADKPETMPSVKSALSDLLHPAMTSRARDEETEASEYESLSLLRLINK